MTTPSDPPADDNPFPGRPPTPADRPLTYSSAEILQGRREVWIEHGDDVYRLRLTAAGRLYLSK